MNKYKLLCKTIRSYRETCLINRLIKSSKTYYENINSLFNVFSLEDSLLYEYLIISKLKSYNN